MFVPLNISSHIRAEKEDQEYIDMIRKIEKERAFYFSYDIDLTKNIQKTVLETRLPMNE